MAFMRTPEEHTAAIARAVPARGQVRVPLADAAGRTLAVPVTADVDSPRFDNSQMDGYALSDAHVAATPGTFTVGKTCPPAPTRTSSTRTVSPDRSPPS